jgi:hypothetical protein
MINLRMKLIYLFEIAAAKNASNAMLMESRAHHPKRGRPKKPLSV